MAAGITSIGHALLTFILTRTLAVMEIIKFIMIYVRSILMALRAWVISLTSVCKTSLNRVLRFISYCIFQGEVTEESLA